MDQWAIRPYEGMGSLRFGMTRSEVASALGSPPQSFQKTMDASSPTDAFNTVGVHVYYDAHMTVEFIEVFPPAVPAFDGLALFSLTSDDLQAHTMRRGYRIEQVDRASWTIPDLGIAIYSPGAIIEGVSIYRRGYYDEG